jgi:glycosyltransferase involved in cell wall biosynthesis
VIAGFYSPLPPARTGVADYAARLLAELQRHGNVEVAPERCEVALYHLGNNRLHAAIYRRALEHPGVVVLHDAVLHHFFLGQLDRKAYIDEFAYNYGDWSRDLAADLWRERASSAADDRYFRFPMLKRILERSRAVVVHNPGAARMVREHAPATPLIEIPHFFDAPDLPPAAEVIRYRQGLGIGAGSLVFGVFGYLRESKRLESVLRAFGRLPQGARLLVAGASVSSDLEHALAPLLRHPGIIRLPYLAPRDFGLAASAADACINLRYPAAGETSGMTIRMMGMGKAVLVTDAEECSLFPEDACIRVAAGIAERESLWRHMVLLTSLPEVARSIGQQGARHIGENHRIEEAARRYWKVLCEHCL